MTIKLRAANSADATNIATLVNLAGEGLPNSLWSAQADYGQDPISVGRNRALGDSGVLSWRTATIAEYNGHTAGVLITYETPEEPEMVDSTTHPLFRPLIRLENQAPRTRYINALATFPQFQKHGIGRTLLQEAERNPGPHGMSAIVANGNTTARKFYVHMGFKESSRLPIVRADWKTDSTEWILLRKS